ncbi:MAG: DMT family transporter [Candidatus Hodarchaeales archaeon]|jgi:drug/metabolite transporter (DMT)-like permease
MINHLYESEKKSEFTAYILLIMTALIWGGTWPLGRWLVSEEVGGATVPPMIITFLRYFLVIWPFLLILYFKEKSLNFKFARMHWKALGFMGFISVTVHQATTFFGQIFTAASDASVLLSVNPIIVVIISCLVVKIEKINKYMVLGTILAFIGILLVIGFTPNILSEDRFLGNLLIITAAFSYAVYTVASKIFLETHEKQITSIYLITWVSIFGLITTVPVTMILNPEYIKPDLFFQIPDRVWWGLSYLIIFSTLLGYWFFIEGIKRLTAVRAAIFQNMVPIFGVSLSAIFLKEMIDPLAHVVSTILIIAGVSLVNRKSSLK